VSAAQLDERSVRRATEGLRLIGQAEALVEFHPALESTNDRLQTLADEGAGEGTLVVAGRQEQGRGRRGRAWSSPAGGLYLSLLLRPDDAMLRRLPVTLLGGLAAAEAIEAACGLRPELKWPNDVMLGGRKVAGILGELARDGAGQRLVLGVGMNVTTREGDLPTELHEVATSLAIEQGAGGPLTEAPAEEALETVLRGFLARFEEHYLAVRRGGGATILSVAWSRMPHLGKPIRVRMGGEVITGIASGLNATGGLVLERENGQRQVIVAGEVEEVRPK